MAKKALPMKDKHIYVVAYAFPVVTNIEMKDPFYRKVEEKEEKDGR